MDAVNFISTDIISCNCQVNDGSSLVVMHHISERNKIIAVLSELINRHITSLLEQEPKIVSGHH